MDEDERIVVTYDLYTLGLLFASIAESLVSLVHVCSNFALLGFALSSILFLLAFQKSQRQVPAAKLSFGLFFIATLSASVALLVALNSPRAADVSGLLLTTVVGWLAIAAHLYFGMRLIGAFVAPLATLILLMASFFASSRMPSPSDSVTPLLLQAHIFAAIVGQAFAIIACAVSVLYLWQQNLLKKKLLNQLPQNVPAIDRLGQTLGVSLWSGFIFITLGLLSGAMYTQTNDPPSGLALEAKVIWATAVWIWYLAILLAKNVFSRPSKRIAQMSLAGFLLLAIAYFGIGFFRPLGGG